MDLRKTDPELALAAKIRELETASMGRTDGAHALRVRRWKLLVATEFNKMLRLRRTEDQLKGLPFFFEDAPEPRRTNHRPLSSSTLRNMWLMIQKITTAVFGICFGYVLDMYVAATGLQHFAQDTLCCADFRWILGVYIGIGSDGDM